MSEIRPLMGGTDGFRGRADLENTEYGVINESTFGALTAALVSVAQEQGMDGPVVVGRDTRPSSPALSEAVIVSAAQAGAEVIDIGIAPTPMIQKIGEAVDAAAVVSVTASHNPAHDNGWKGMVGIEKPLGTLKQAISDRYYDLIDDGFRLRAGETDVQRAHSSEMYRYSRMLIHDIESQFGERPLTGKVIIYDGAYGAASHIAPRIFSALGAKLETVACGKGGVINNGYGAADLSGVSRVLETEYAELLHDPDFLGAITNDGDADRVMAVALDKRGKAVVLDGNHMMSLMAEGQQGIVGTLYTNSGLRESLADRGIAFEECGNGDAYVTEKLRQRQKQGDRWYRGGEFTGHIIDTMWLPSGDGIRAAAWLAAYAATRNVSFSEIHADMPLWHERMEKVALLSPAIGKQILSSGALIEQLDRVESGAYGAPVRPIVRASGTEPVIRVWAESSSEAALNTAVDDMLALTEQLSQQ